MVINICEMIILTHKKKSDFYLKYWQRYSTLKILHLKGMDNLMIMLIPLFPNSAMIQYVYLFPGYYSPIVIADLYKPLYYFNKTMPSGAPRNRLVGHIKAAEGDRLPQGQTL